MADKTETGANELAELLKKKARHRLSKKKLLIGAGALLLAAGLTAGTILFVRARKAAAEANEAVYREYTVEYGDISVGETESSSVSLEREALSFPASTTVEEVYVKAGSSVKEGDPLVKLNVEEIEASVASYELQLEKASLELEQAKLEQQANLLKAGQKLETSLETGELADDNADNAVTELSLSLESAKKSLSESEDKLSEYYEMYENFESDYTYLNYLKGIVEDITEDVEDIEALLNYESDAESMMKLYDEVISKYDAAEKGYKELTDNVASLKKTADDAESDYAAKAAEYDSAKKIYDDAVAAGETDLDAKKKAMDEAEAAMTAAKTDSDAAAAAYTTAETDAQSKKKAYKKIMDDIEDQYGDIDDLRDGYDDYEEEKESVDTITATRRLKDRKADLESATEEYNDFKEDFDDSYGNITELQELLDAIEDETAAVKQAELKLSEASVSYKEGSTKAEQTEDTAKAEAETAETSYELDMMSLDQVVETAQEKYDGLETQLEEVKSYINDEGIVYSPVNGMVASIYVEAGDELAVSVDSDTYMIMQYAPIASITDISSVYVPITITEDEILDVYIGQEANVTMTAFTGRTFDAEIDTISVESSRSGAATVSYTVNVVFSETNTLDMYEGMSAEVTLLTRECSGVLYITNNAISNTGGVATVLVPDENGEPVERVVTTGFSDGTYCEITSGLSEGETVLVQSSVGRS